MNDRLKLIPVLDDCKDLSLGDFMKHITSSNIDLGIKFSISKKGIGIKIERPISLNFMNELELSVVGETNIVSKGLNLDTLFDFHGTVLQLNGRVAKQIKDHPKSVAYREERLEKLKKIEELARDISHPVLPANASLEDKIKFLKSHHDLKDITGKEPFPIDKE